jgi:hypothetical protein
VKHSPDVCDSRVCGAGQSKAKRTAVLVTQIDRATGKSFAVHKTSAIRRQAYQLQQLNISSLIAALFIISLV